MDAKMIEQRKRRIALKVMFEQMQLNDDNKDTKQEDFPP
jgi:hypothetical protein